MSGCERVLILAGDTDGNLGDRGLVRATCDALRTVTSHIQLSLLSSRPEVDRAYFGAAAIPRGPRGLPQLMQEARKADLVLIGGGGLFQDDDSLVKMPYWAARVLLMRLCCPRVVGFSLGVGPLRSTVGRLTAQWAFRLMQAVSVRDPEAQSTAAPLSNKPVQLVPDPALLLEPLAADVAEAYLRERDIPVGERPLIGVAARRWFYKRGGLIPHKYRVKLGLSPASGLEENRQCIAALARVLDHAAKVHGAHVVFMPSYAAVHEGDREICDAVRSAMDSSAASLLTIDDPRLYKAIAGRLSVFLCGRMHPAIFAAASGTPVVGLAYNQKFHGFFELLGLPDRVLPLERFANDDMTDELGRLLDTAMAEGRAPLERVQELQGTIRAYLQGLC